MQYSHLECFLLLVLLESQGPTEVRRCMVASPASPLPPQKLLGSDGAAVLGQGFPLGLFLFGISIAFPEMLFAVWGWVDTDNCISFSLPPPQYSKQL